VFETNQPLVADERGPGRSPSGIPSSRLHQQVYTKVIPGTAVKIDEYRHLLSCIIDVAISRYNQMRQRPNNLLPIKSLECREIKKRDY
jgi:hypothetical protein